MGQMSKERITISVTPRQKKQLEKRSKAGRFAHGGDY